MAIGPRNRDYDVTLTDKLNYSTQPLAGGAWTVQSLSTQVERWGRLNVVNPWRASKPVVDTPTARNLKHYSLKNMRGETKFVGSQVHWRAGVFATAGAAAVNVTVASQRSDLVNRAVLSALRKLKDQKFNAGVAIAEAEGVARMVIDVAKTATEIRDFLRHGSFKEAYNRFRMHDPNYMTYPEWSKKYWDKVRHVESVRRAALIPEGWLYYHYGLKPTVNDIDGAITELILKGRTNPNVFKGKVVGYAKVRQNLSQLSSDGTIVASLQSAVIESVRAVLHVQAKDGVGGKLSTLGVTNPAEAVWNRIPFSFLVDYLYGVNEWLHVLDAWVGWDFGDWEESYRMVRDTKIVPDQAESAKLAKLTLFHVTPGKFSFKEVDRVIHNTLYGPMAFVKPRVKIPSATQLANTLSLLATGFKRTVRP